MKTPRRLLFDKHRKATPALDLIRKEALRTIRPAIPFPTDFLIAVALKLWRELFLPSRRIWSGLAVAWMAVFGFNFAASFDSTPMYANMKPISREVIMANQAQRMQLAKLIEQLSEEPIEPPILALPPRSERKSLTAIG